jgi:hypothetical protein
MHASHGRLGEWTDDVRLEELVTTLELLVLRLDDLDTVDDFEEAGLESLGLSVGAC